MDACRRIGSQESCGYRTEKSFSMFTWVTARHTSGTSFTQSAQARSSGDASSTIPRSRFRTNATAAKRSSRSLASQRKSAKIPNQASATVARNLLIVAALALLFCCDAVFLHVIPFGYEGKLAFGGLAFWFGVLLTVIALTLVSITLLRHGRTRRHLALLI